MSMVHPALLAAKRTAEDGRRKDEELRHYVATEYKGNHFHWFASLRSGGVMTKPAKKPVAPNLTDHVTESKASSESCCPVMRALSESTLPRGEAAGKR